MRVAAIVVSMLVVVTPAQASRSCMSKTEARQHFGAVHIYWHGADHCWDASRASHRYQIRVRRKTPIHEVQQKKDQAKWHDSMFRMLADDEPEESASFDVGHRENDGAVAGMQWINRWVDIEPSNRPLDARWVDIAQDMPLSVIQRKPEPMISPHVVLLALITITIALTLATIEFMFRRTADK
jgi:hypothetical protein